MSYTFRSQSDNRLVPSLSTSPRRRVAINETPTFNSTLETEHSNDDSRTLALALGFGPESVFHYADRVRLSPPRDITDQIGILERLRNLSLLDSDASSTRRPFTAPLVSNNSQIELEREIPTEIQRRRRTEFNNSIEEDITTSTEEITVSVFNVEVNQYSSNESSPRPRRQNRSGRNIQILRNESRNLISQLSNENSQALSDLGQASLRCPLSTSGGVQFRHVSIMVDLHYLQTKEYRNNFYYNLVTWSRNGKKLAVAANEYAYWWDGKQHVAPIELFGYPKPILVILCGPDDIIAIGFENDDHCSLCLQISEGRWVWFPNNCAFQCITWHPEKPILFTGDMYGRLFILEYNQFIIQIKANWRGFDQLVCGM